MTQNQYILAVMKGILFYKTASLRLRTPILTILLLNGSSYHLLDTLLSET